VSFGAGANADLILHSVDGLRQTPRGRGLDANPRSYDGVIEVPQLLLTHVDQQDPRVRDFIERDLNGRRFTSTPLEATPQALTINVLQVTLQHTDSTRSNPVPFQGVTVISRAARLDGHGNLTLRIACPATAIGDCTGNMVARAHLRRRALELGRAPFDVPAGRVSGVRLRVSRAARRLIIGHGRLAATLTATARDSSADQVSSQTPLTVRRRR
jgi:hypothetical protein